MGIFEIAIIVVTVIVVFFLLQKKPTENSERVVTINEPKSRRNRIKKSEIFVIKEIFNFKKVVKTPRVIAFIEFQYDRGEDRNPEKVIFTTLESTLKSILKDVDIMKLIFSTKDLKNYSYDLAEKTKKMLNSFLPQHIIISSIILEILNPIEKPKSEKWFAIKRNLELPKRNTNYEMICSFEELDPSYIERLSFIILQNYTEKMLKQFDEREFITKTGQNINLDYKNDTINNISDSNQINEFSNSIINHNDFSNSSEFEITIEQVRSLFMGEPFNIIEFHWNSKLIVSSKTILDKLDGLDFDITEETQDYVSGGRGGGHFVKNTICDFQKLNELLYRVKFLIENEPNIEKKKLILDKFESKMILESRDPSVLNNSLIFIEDLKSKLFISNQTESKNRDSNTNNNTKNSMNSGYQFINNSKSSENDVFDNNYNDDLNDFDNKKKGLFNDSFDLKVDKFD